MDKREVHVIILLVEGDTDYQFSLSKETKFTLRAAKVKALLIALTSNKY